MPRLNAKKIKKESGNSTSHSVLVSEVKTMKKNQMMKKMKMKNQLMKPKIQAARILMIWFQKIAVSRLAVRSMENNNSFVNSNVQKEPISWEKMVSAILLKWTVWITESGQSYIKLAKLKCLNPEFFESKRFQNQNVTIGPTFPWVSTFSYLSYKWPSGFATNWKQFLGKTGTKLTCKCKGDTCKWQNDAGKTVNGKKMKSYNCE